MSRNLFKRGTITRSLFTNMYQARSFHTLWMGFYAHLTESNTESERGDLPKALEQRVPWLVSWEL